MFHRKAVQVLLISAILLHGQLQLSQAYTKVSTSGSSGQSEEGPKIYKALNFDLIFPKSFNSSENVISTTQSAPLETGSPATVLVDGSAGRQQHNPLPQSNEQTNRDDNGDVGDRRPPLYITPSPNEAALYQTPQSTNSNSNTHDKDNNAQVVTQNPINIQQQQQQRNDNNNNNNNGAPKEQQQNIATGRAVDYHTGYPFGQLITPLIKNAPRPVYSNNNNGSGSKGKPMVSPLYSTSSSSPSSSVVYPQAGYQRKPPSRAEIDKLRGRGPIKDRFTPSEAVASHQIKASNHHHNHAPTYANAAKIPSSSNVVNTYVPPTNLYSFPPNNVDYPSPTQDNKVAMPSSVVNSYSPPPSGSHDSGYSYAGPLNLGYLPSINGDNGNGDAKDQQKDNNNDDGDTENGDMDDSIGVLPASAMGGDNNAGDGMDGMDPMMPMKDDHSTDDHHDDHSYDTEKEYPTPPPEWLKAHPEALKDHPHDEHDHDDDHDHHNHDEDHQPDIEFDHDHDHHHHPDIIFDHDSHPYHHSFPSFPIYPHYPEIIYDDHHHHHHEEPPPTTTEAPPPEPPPEPRVKKYSYFYIGRKLWYIPLYFTVWFSFYVLWLILKSIARHKVNLPNHYVSRRSVDNYNLSKSQQEVINQLTVSVMDKIEKFKRKHLS